MALIRSLRAHCRNLLIAGLGTLLVGLPVGVFGDLVAPLFGVGSAPVPPHASILLFFLGAILSISLGILLLRYSSLGGILQSEAKELDLGEPIKTLIIGLSPLNVPVNEVKTAVETFGLHDLAQDVAGYAAWSKGKEPRPPTPTWQQAWRAIHAHRKSLREVIVVPSPESARGFDDFRRTLNTLLDKDEDLRSVKIRLALPVGFEAESLQVRLRQRVFPNYVDYDATHRALRRAIEMSDCPHRHVCIDYTSGTAAFSIAAVAITINTDVRIGYVETFTKLFGDESATEGTVLSGGRVRLYRFGIALPSSQ